MEAAELDIARRVLSKRILCTLLMPVGHAAWAQASATEEAEQDVRETWMRQWMNRPAPPEGSREPVGALMLSRFVEPIYFLLAPIGWRPSNERGKALAPVEAPAGFVSDLASIPQVFWSLLRPDGDYAYAAILHDYMYWTQTRSRSDADATFRLAMEDFGVPRGTSTVIHTAVQAAGQQAWDRNRELTAKGEKRVLKKLPKDPLTRWRDWKKNPDVFE